MTQEDLDALNSFLKRYPVWRFSVHLMPRGLYDFSAWHTVQGGIVSKLHYPTVAEAIADVVAQMEAGVVA